MSVSAQPRQRRLGIFTISLAATFYLNVLFLWPKFVISLYVKQSFAFIFSRNYQQYFKLHFWPEHLWSSHFNPSPDMRRLKAVVMNSQRSLFSFLFHPEPRVRLKWPHRWNEVWLVYLCGVTPSVHSPQGLISLLLELQVGFLSSSHMWSVENQPLRSQGWRLWCPLKLILEQLHNFYIEPIISPSLSATLLWFLKKCLRNNFIHNFKPSELYSYKHTSECFECLLNVCSLGAYSLEQWLPCSPLYS